MDSEVITPEQSLPTLVVFHHDLKAPNNYSESENYHGPIGKSWFHLGCGEQEHERDS